MLQLIADRAGGAITPEELLSLAEQIGESYAQSNVKNGGFNTAGTGTLMRDMTFGVAGELDVLVRMLARAVKAHMQQHHPAAAAAVTDKMWRAVRTLSVYRATHTFGRGADACSSAPLDEKAQVCY